MDKLDTTVIAVDEAVRLTGLTCHEIARKYGKIISASINANIHPESIAA